MNPDLFFLESLQNANMSNALGSAAPQSQADTGIKGIELHA
jgi:hypothetical protein